MDGKTVKHPFYTLTSLVFILLVVVPVLYTLVTTFFTGGTLGENLLSFKKET